VSVPSEPSMSICSAPTKAGDSCQGDFECRTASKIYCVDSVCVQAPFANGEKCANAPQCKSESCVAGKCRPKGQEGDPCGGTAPPCEDGYYCGDADPVDGGASGICAAKKPQGELCATDQECWTRCQPTNGALRCVGVGTGHAFCSGR
jgi:hypothetical protein